MSRFPTGRENWDRDLVDLLVNAENTAMQPLRPLFILLSRIPPHVMLALIIGFAASLSWMISHDMTSKAQVYEDKLHNLEKERNAKASAVFAIKDIPQGQEIPIEALETREIERTRVPQDAIETTSLAAGRTAKYGITAGNIVSQHDLQPRGIELGFEAMLPRGMRAVTFAVDTNTGVAGFIAPRSHVDILAMVGAGADTRASAILSDVEVIAVGQTYQKPAGATTAIPVSNVTVAVSPPDATKLVKAIVASRLYLSLRNQSDHTPVATVEVNSLFSRPSSGSNNLPSLSMDLLPPPPVATVSGLDVPVPNQQTIASKPFRPGHEVEVWTAGTKDMVTFK